MFSTASQEVTLSLGCVSLAPWVDPAFSLCLGLSAPAVTVANDIYSSLSTHVYSEELIRCPATKPCPFSGRVETMLWNSPCLFQSEVGGQAADSLG